MFDELVAARIDQADFEPSTGLVCLTVYVGRKLRWVAGIGPGVVGLGVGERSPRIRAASTQPLVAALRAHLVDHRVRSIVEEDGVIWLAAGGDSLQSRVAIRVARRGWVEVFGADGSSIVRWPPRVSDVADKPGDDGGGRPAPTISAPTIIGSGDDLVTRSDSLAIERERETLARAVQRHVDVLERRNRAVLGDLARLDDVERLQKVGRLLLAQGPRVPKGAASATLEDWEEGGSIDVALDPSRPAKAQAEGYFQKARRLQRGRTVMQQRLEQTRLRIDEARRVADEIATAPADVDAIASLAERARALGVAKPTTAASSSANAQAVTRRSRLPFNLYRDARGRPILVGRGGRDNDELITHHARPHDLWLHAKGIHGAHVIVPIEKNTSCPAELLVDAATLAVHHSDARGESTCEVSYVERRHVRKPRKSPPGAVTFDHEKVLVLRLEPDRLARLLATHEPGAGAP